MELSRALPVLIQYGGGAVLCAVGVWAGIKSGYLDLKLPDDRRVVAIIIAGYVGLLIFSCIFTFWLPYLGGEAE